MKESLDIFKIESKIIVQFNIYTKQHAATKVSIQRACKSNDVFFSILKLTTLGRQFRSPI